LGLGRLLAVTGGYIYTGDHRWLLKTMGDYWRILGITGDYWRILGITGENWKLLQLEISGGYLR